MEYLPLFFNLRGRRVLLVGGGKVALRKARLVTRAGAGIFCVAPDIDHELDALIQATGGEWRVDSYRTDHLAGVDLAIAATHREAVNRAVASDARRHHIPVNVVDAPALCSFVFPSIVDRSPLVIAISSSAKSPVLARLVRSKIEAMIPATYGRLAAFSGRFREAVKRIAGGEGERRRFWEQVINGPAGEMVLAGREDEAARLVQQYLDSPRKAHPIGEVYLIGAGPGDPDLLSFKAARLLQRADVVLYDRLVTPEILDLARRDAERIYVGKRRADHAVPQARINALLLELAKKGRCVARLKGGDPFIFGRGGEEIAELASHGIPFQVVPGITAASGCACYAGIPLTHRDYAQSVRFITGNLQSDKVDLAWEHLVGEQETLVFYMGLKGLETICENLVAHGMNPETPAAIIEQGTTRNQRTVTGTLSDLAGKVGDAVMHAPTLIIVGQVVALRDRLKWFGEAEASTPWPPAAGDPRHAIHWSEG